MDLQKQQEPQQWNRAPANAQPVPVPVPVPPPAPAPALTLAQQSMMMSQEAAAAPATEPPSPAKPIAGSTSGKAMPFTVLTPYFTAFHRGSAASIPPRPGSRLPAARQPRRCTRRRTRHASRRLGCRASSRRTGRSHRRRRGASRRRAGRPEGQPRQLAAAQTRRRRSGGGGGAGEEAAAVVEHGDRLRRVLAAGQSGARGAGWWGDRGRAAEPVSVQLLSLPFAACSRCRLLFLSLPSADEAHCDRRESIDRTGLRRQLFDALGKRTVIERVFVFFVFFVNGVFPPCFFTSFQCIKR